MIVYKSSTAYHLRGHTVPPGLVGRRSLDLELTIGLHASEIAAGIDALSLNPLDLEFTDAKGIIGDPDNGLRFPHGRVVKGFLVEARGVAVSGTGVVVLFIGRARGVVQLAVAVVGSTLGGGQAGLASDSTETTVLDSVGRVGVDKVVLLESEPINVDLESGGRNDLNNLTRSVLAQAVRRSWRDSP
jgi:hypothetical protein